mmetsp:Transcript_25016/g.79288  ORF Transcript_25016/g.79288 Transcript_25016/m.79288 type:complete len:303 (+) Transcript_25016:234-1142(+)
MPLPQGAWAGRGLPRGPSPPATTRPGTESPLRARLPPLFGQMGRGARAGGARGARPRERLTSRPLASLRRLLRPPVTDTSRTTTAAVGSAGVPRHSAPLAAPGTSLRSPPARPPPPPARRGGGTAGQRHPASRGALCSRMGAIPRGRPRVAARSRPRTLSRKAACRGGKSPRPRPAARGDPADGPIWSPPRTRWVASNCPTRPSSEGGQICRSFSGARMRTPWAATSSPAPLVEVRPPRNSRRAGAPLPSSSETRTSIPRTSGRVQPAAPRKCNWVLVRMGCGRALWIAACLVYIHSNAAAP